MQVHVIQKKKGATIPLGVSDAPYI